MTEQALQERLEKLRAELARLKSPSLTVTLNYEVNHEPTLLSTIGPGNNSEHSDTPEARAFVHALINKRKSQIALIEARLQSLPSTSNREKTRYRIVRCDTYFFRLEFLTVIEKSTLGFRRIKLLWQPLPNIHTPFHGPLTRLNAASVASNGIALKDFTEHDLKRVAIQYPCVEDYITQYNKLYEQWLVRKRADEQRPDIITL